MALYTQIHHKDVLYAVSKHILKDIIMIICMRYYDTVLCTNTKYFSKDIRMTFL